MFEQDHPSIVDEVGIHSLVGSGDREVAKVGDTCRGRRTRTCREQKCLQIKGFEHLPCSLLYQDTLDSAATSLPPTPSDLALLGTPTLTAVAMADVNNPDDEECGPDSKHTESPAAHNDVLATTEQEPGSSQPRHLYAHFISNRIYEDAPSDCVLVHPAFQYPTSMMYEPDSSMHDLPLACRQLCQETHLLVYKYGLFEIRRSERGDIRVVYHAA
ncbi:uncharacterized protein CC84DRAFT_1174194 [Paraphaeosphaeria sporulosa]|uniref:Uncharacterized protein n=1 Tax=Paraphaeosphaeria sporulosa TaxID=1460663 RepID=A0A177CPT1_9PLEO|nr:uncharacterized protein CC84DRAFT_1174194 [Paraphaeosphaeria sporulosa]OAG08767.1 hypothetical protein CC84DRAFT_1174194 [Paraphaeosphaeria sporulosa]